LDLCYHYQYKEKYQVTELETIHATAEQQEEELERLLKKNNKE